MGRSGDQPVVVVTLNTGLQLVASVEANAVGVADQVDTAAQTLIANTWNHFALVVVRDAVAANQRLHLYVNGGAPATAVATVWSNSFISSIPTDPTLLGTGRADAGTLQSPLTGRLDEIRIWNYARTQTEILADKNRELTSAPGLVHRWGLNEATGTTTADSVGTSSGHSEQRQRGARRISRSRAATRACTPT